MTTSDTNTNMLAEINTRRKMNCSTESQLEIPAHKRSTSQSDNHMKNTSVHTHATKADGVQDNTNNESGDVPVQFLFCSSGGLNARETNRVKRDDFNGNNIGQDVSHDFG